MSSLLLALLLQAASASPSGAADADAERSAAGHDPLAAGRRALHELAYERAVQVLTRVAEDERVDDGTQARAYMLLAEARFGMARADAELSAKSAFHAALALDPNIDFEERADVSPRLIAIFEPLRPTSTTSTTNSSRATSASAGSASGASPAGTTSARDGAFSPWWIASAGLATAAVVAGGVVGGIELYLTSPPAGLAADDVRATQGVGVAAVILALGAGIAAAGTTAIAALE